MHAIDTINQLPSIAATEARSRSLALADAILMPEWQYRYFSFNASWDKATGNTMASVRDGAGAEYFLLFSEDGVAGKVLAERTLPNPAEHQEKVPDVFQSFRTEPAFDLANASYFVWRQLKEERWHCRPEAPVPLLGFLCGGFAGYAEWAEDYYDIPRADFALLEKVFVDPHAMREIAFEELLRINPELDRATFQTDMDEILGSPPTA